MKNREVKIKFQFNILFFLVIIKRILIKINVDFTFCIYI